MTDRELMQQMLDSIKEHFKHHEKNCVYLDDVYGLLRARLLNPEPKPVAWLYTNKLGGRQVSLIDPPADMKEQYQPLYLVPPQTNSFNPDWDAIPVMVEEQQRMAKRIEELESQLGEAMWGYGEWRRKAEISSQLCTRQSIRLMEYESQEPIACVGPWHDGKLTLIPRYSRQTFERDQPLYTAPPQRKPLTREVIDRDFYGRFDFVRKVEAAHGITGDA